MRCDPKDQPQGAKRSRGLPPGEALQRRGWPLGSQPAGKGVKKTPLCVARLGQTSSLAVALRLHRRFFNRLRTCILSVNRP